MKIENLSEGQVIKNYKALCCELEIEQKKSTKSKKYQLRDLERYFEFHNDGRKFIIDKIYDEPKPKVDGRGKSKGSRNNNDKLYDNLIQWLLLDLLAQKQNNGKLCISRSGLLREIDMTNYNYGYLIDYKDKIAKKIEANEFIVHDFYKTNNTHFKRAIESALKDLVDKRIIEYNTIKMVKKKFVNEHKVANDDDIEIILKVEKDVLEQMGYEKKSEMINDGRYFEYWAKVNECIYAESDIEYYYAAYNIIINQHYIDKELNSLLDLLLKDAKREEYKDDLNNRVTEHLLKNAERRHETELKKEEWNPFDVEDYRCNNEYVEKIKQLNELLIRRNTPNMVHEIRKITIDND